MEQNDKKVIVDNKELTEEQLEELKKNKSVKVNLNEDGSFKTVKRLND